MVRQIRKILADCDRPVLSVLCALFVAVQAVYWAFQPPQMQLDSGSYIEFAAVRSAGYPLYLKLLGVEWGTRLQALWYGLALLFLSAQVSKTAGSRLIGFLLFIACSVNVELNKYHAWVMTESLFLSVEVVFLGLLLRSLRTASWRDVVLLSMTAGLAGIIRPNGYVLVIIAGMMPLLLAKRGSLRPVIIAALLPAVLICGGERLGVRLYKGDDVTSLAGRHFYAKAALLDVPQPLSDNPDERFLQQSFDQSFGPVRAVLADIPRWDIRLSIAENYEACLEYVCSNEIRDHLPYSEAKLNALELKVAMERIRRAPAAFVGLVGRHYISLWTLYQASHPGAVESYRRFLADKSPLPFQERIPDFNQAPAPSALAVVVQPLFWIMGGATLLLAVWGAGYYLLGRLSQSLAIAATAALMIHGSFLFIAVFGLGIPRYSLGLWPAIMVSLLFGVITVCPAVFCPSRGQDNV